MTIGTNSSTYRMLAAINALNSQMSQTMTRLATGNRINRASDDPSGLVALNALNGELASINASLDNNQRTQSFLNVADSTLTEVGSLVSGIQDLVLKAQGSTSTSEKAAYQAQIDQSIDSIDRLVNQAQFNGKKIFNGENRINAYADNGTAITDVRVFNRNPNITGNQTLNVNVLSAAQKGNATTTLDATSGTTLTAATVLQVTGKLGTATITVASGATGADVLKAINAQTQVTGVSAFDDGGNLGMRSSTAGSDSFVTVSTLSGDSTYMAGLQINKTVGTDARVTINGAEANAQGTEVFYNGNGVSMSFNLADDTAGQHTITISGGGAQFKLGSDANSRASLGMAGINTFELGRSDLGYLSQLKSGGANSLFAQGSKALEIVQHASNQVSVEAARLGSFNNYQVGSSIRALQAAQEGVSTAADTIGKTDYSAESAKLQQQQILMSAAVSMLSMANVQQANVLTLLK